MSVILLVVLSPCRPALHCDLIGKFFLHVYIWPSIKLLLTYLLTYSLGQKLAPPLLAEICADTDYLRQRRGYVIAGVYLVLCAVAIDQQYFFVGVFFSVRTITHEPLHSARLNFARTLILTTARTLLNFKVIGHRSRSFFSLVDQSSPNYFHKTWEES